MKHISVLPKETINSLEVKKGGIYIDCTLGHGGHSSKILEILDGTGHLYGIDQDKEAIVQAKKKLSKYKNYTIVNDNFINLEKIINEHNIDQIDGILFDIGVNSAQFDDGSRGFSYHYDADLDMRMNQDSDLTAMKILNEYDFDSLVKMFRVYGDVKNSVQLTKQIIKEREEEEIKTTFDLNKIIDTVNPNWTKKNPYKQPYQALRIEVNNEIGAIEDALQIALDKISIDGKVSVITFHSLEDRVVKQVYIKNKKIFLETPMEIKYKYKTSKTVYPTKEEIEQNVRSRSAKLRTIRKIY